MVTKNQLEKRQRNNEINKLIRNENDQKKKKNTKGYLKPKESSHLHPPQSSFSHSYIGRKENANEVQTQLGLVLLISSVWIKEKREESTHREGHNNPQTMEA